MYFNLDCTDFFWTHKVEPGEAGEAIDTYIDSIIGAGVDVLLCNTNARRTNYKSAVWDSFWDGYDPNGPDDQPFLAPVPQKDVAHFRKGIGVMQEVDKQGIDYPARVIQRCRDHRVSPWVTLRMNDCHNNDVLNHPFHGMFWQNNPQFFRKNCTGYFANCLDYAHPEVRDYFMALIDETLERYDTDGLELDFMRDPYCFSADKEAEGAPILTEWMRDVHKRVEAAAKKRKRHIKLGVRVPSRPETSLAMGFDAVTWASEGLIDVLVVTPRWESTQFDMPIGQWREMLRKTEVSLVGGLEVLCRPFPGSRAAMATPELGRGGSIMVLSEGADGLYLFNHFPSTLSAWPDYQNALKSMKSLKALLKLPRCIAITYPDTRGPKEQYQFPLPATGLELAFRMGLGPIPDEDWVCEALIGILPDPDDSLAVPTLSIDGTPGVLLKENPVDKGLRVITYEVPVKALKGKKDHEIKVLSADQKPVTVKRVEVLLRP